jgi:DNA-binding NarL/FixJ family response regulator
MGSNGSSGDQRAIGVLVVDDHTTFSDLLSMAVSSEPDMECVGTAPDRAEALELVEKHRPEVVVMDVQLGSDNGISVTAELTAAYKDLSVVILTAHANRDMIMNAAAADASCLLPKNGALPGLLKAIRSARRGGFIVDPELLRALVLQTQAEPTRAVSIPALTARELEVLQHLVQGKDSTTIAGEMGLTLNTYRGYVKSISKKLDAHSQLEAVVIAIRHGIVDV